MERSDRNHTIYSFFPSVRRSKTPGDFFNIDIQKVLKEPSANNRIVAPTQLISGDDTERLEKGNSALKTQLECANVRIDELTKENKKYVSDLISLKKLYNATCQSYVKKEIQLKNMEKKQMSHAEIHESLYEGFKHTLDESTIQRLRVIGDKRCADSTFILTCITKIYGNEANLNEVSACGRKKNKIMSPAKRKLIDDIFFERLVSLNLDETELNERHQRLNSLINSSINNISRKKVIQLVFCIKRQYRKVSCSHFE